MKHRPSLWLVMAALAAPVAAVAQRGGPANEAADPASAFKGDARLDAKVHLAAKNQPLGELLPEVGKQLGLKLTATRETADDKTTLYLNERPASEALGLIARQFDFQWLKSGAGYELTQSIASRRREQALRDAELVAQVDGAIRRVETVKQLLNLPPQQLEARRTEINNRTGMADVTPEERYRLAEENAAIQDALRPGARAAVGLYTAIGAQRVRQLAPSGDLRLSTADGSLPNSAASAVHQAANQMTQSGQVMRVVTGERVAPPGGAPAAPPVPPRPNDADFDNLPTTGATARIRWTDAPALMVGMRTGPGIRRPRRLLRLDFTMTSQRGEQGRTVSLPVMWTPLVLPPQELSDPAPTQTDDPDLNREIDLKLPAPEAPNPNDPGAVVSAITIGNNWPAGQATLGDAAEALHRETGLEVVSDAFVRARMTPNALNGKKKVVQILDQLAKQMDYTWTKEGKQLRFRSRYFYYDRPAEVPNRVVFPWRDRVGKQGAPGLDDLAVLAAALSDDQCRGMQDNWGWYLEGANIPAPQGLNGFYGVRQHLRFWATLVPAQKQVLKDGQVVPTAKMTQQQRQAFVVALTAPSDLPAGLNSDVARPPAPAEVATGGFRLSHQEFQQRQFASTGPDGTQRMVTMMSGAMSLGGPGGPGGAGGASGYRIGGGPGGPGVPPGPGAGGGGVIRVGPRPDGAAPGGAAGGIAPAPLAPPAAPGGAPRILGPGGELSELKPFGTPTTLDGFTFNYHLAGQEQPARTQTINLPRPAPKATG